MTEKEKMLNAKPYKALDKVLVAERQKTQQLLFELNKLSPLQSDERYKLIKLLLGKIGANPNIELPFRCDYGYNIEIGENFYSNYSCIILDCAKVRIGDDVYLGPTVSIYTAGHPIDAEMRKKGWEYAFPVSIGNSVWIGGNVVINPGVAIGNNVVIGSGSVVTNNIPDNVVAVGNPCRILRHITSEDSLYYFKKQLFDDQNN